MSVEREKAIEEFIDSVTPLPLYVFDEMSGNTDRVEFAAKKIARLGFEAGHAHALTPRKNQYWLILFQSHERAGADPHWLVDTEDYAKEICKNNNGNLSATASFAPWTYIPIELLPPTPQEG